MRAQAVAGEIAGLIGGTPLVRLGAPGPGAAVYAKCEQYNPGGSVKDRVARAALDAAAAEGWLAPGATLVAASAGNFGISLALVARPRGHRVILSVPATTTGERVHLLRAYGAEVERVAEPAAAAAAHVAKGALELRPDGPPAQAAHAETAREILAQLGMLGLAPSAFVTAVGTGATLNGAGSLLAAAGCRVLGVGEAPDPLAPEGWPGIQGMAPLAELGLGTRGITATLAYQHKTTLARRHGLLVGHSAGAAAAAAFELAATLPPGAVVVTLLADTGERYFGLDALFAGRPGA